MQYRRFGRLDWKVSALGFGCMRFPTTDGKPMSKKIDEKRATRMIRYAIDHGVNYLDTAYPYHGGKGESFLAKTLRDGYRDKVRIATKSPIWLVKKRKDFDTYLDEQLKRLRADQVDFYLFHALNRKTWREKVLKLGLLDRAEAAIEDGRIGHVGFSFHDTYDAFKEIIDGYDGWTLCQIQYNFLDTTNQAGTRGLKYASSKGLAVVVMEPLLGGRLSTPPKPVKQVLERANMRRSPSDLALTWLWDQPQVSVVLSGMTKFGQVRQNIMSAGASEPGSMTKRDRKLIERLQRMYQDLSPIPCTKCGYCMPCPNGVNIPANLEVYIDGIVDNDLVGARNRYGRFVGKKARASVCAQCGKCERKCPQKIPIREWMVNVHRVLGEGKSPPPTC